MAIPHGNYCCGGGAGLVACSDWSEDRLKYGDTKAKQIKDIKASKVVTACDNCLHQIQELGEKHDLNITVSNVSQLVVNAMVINKIERPEVLEHTETMKS